MKRAHGLPVIPKVEEDSEDGDSDASAGEAPPSGQGVRTARVDAAEEEAPSEASTSAPATPAVEREGALPHIQAQDALTQQALDSKEEDDLTASLAARPIMPSKIVTLAEQMAAQEKETGPKKRLINHKMVFVDFKS